MIYLESTHFFSSFLEVCGGSRWLRKDNGDDTERENGLAIWRVEKSAMDSRTVEGK